MLCIPAVFFNIQKSPCLYFLGIKKDIHWMSFFSAGNRNRTGTGITTHGILSPRRLPVPPCRRKIKYGTYRARTYDPLLVRQMLSQLS